MKQFTIADIIKILPFEEAYRIELGQRLVNANPSERYEIEKICWDAFWEMNKALVDIKYKAVMDSIGRGEKKYELADALKQAKRAVWQDYEDILSGKTKDIQQMDEIRNKLKDLFQQAQ